MFFHEWLQAHRYGRATEEWADEFAELVRRAQETQRAGTMTITIEVKPKGRTVQVTDSIKVKRPTFDREVGTYWPDDEGRLHREDPAQQKLQLADVTDIDHKSRAAGETNERE